MPHNDYAIVLMGKKYETCRIRICNVFFFLNTSSVSHLNKFYLKKKKKVLSE